MATQGSAVSDKSRLETAKSEVDSRYRKVKSQRTQYNNAVSDLKWKGNTLSTIVTGRKIGAKYDDWIWRWGSSDDGSINGILDRLNSEIGGLQNFIDSLFN